jgi:serine phosphatase RsbU (regulator of sigma subunit)
MHILHYDCLGVLIKFFALEQFGKLRMKETVRASRALPPEEIIKSLYDAVVAHSKGTWQQDDLTAVLIKRD